MRTITYTTTIYREDDREIEVTSAYWPGRPRPKFGRPQPTDIDDDPSVSITSALFTDTGEPATLTDEEQENVTADVEFQARGDEDTAAEARAEAAYEARNEYAIERAIERAQNDYERGLFRERD